MILINAARCLKCDEVLYSNSRYDFRSCSCGNVFVDGGKDYIRHGFIDEALYEDLSKQVEGPQKNDGRKVGW